MALRVLVCGSRYWDDEEIIRTVLEGLLSARKGKPFRVIHGGAKGADKLAAKVARSLDLKVKGYPVDKEDWEKHGKAAGPMRNKRMIEKGKPDLVLAFHDHPTEKLGGTYDTLCKAAEADIQAYVVSRWRSPF